MGSRKWDLASGQNSSLLYISRPGLGSLREPFLVLRRWFSNSRILDTAASKTSSYLFYLFHFFYAGVRTG